MTMTESPAPVVDTGSDAGLTHPEDVDVTRAELDDGLWVVEALRKSELVTSNGEARRLIKNSGARVNDAVVSDADLRLGAGDVGEDGVIKLSSGRKRHALLRVV